jgi:hypothetical protein
MLCHLPPDLSARYASLVGALAPSVERRLHPGVIANRVGPGPSTMLEPWPLARARLRRALRTIGRPGRGTIVVRSDVRECYASITRGSVADAVARLGAPDAVRALLAMLDRFHAYGGEGLPIGPEASAVLANAVLAAGDRAIAATGVPHVRWVDDVLIFATGRDDARRAFDAWRRSLEEVGLEANSAKTTIDTDPRWLGRWATSPLAPPSGVR